MDVKTSEVNGLKYLEIVSRNYQAIRSLENEHQKIGRKTWVNLFNACEGSWSLTVLMGK